MDEYSSESSVNEMWPEIKCCIQTTLDEHEPSMFTTITLNRPWITRKIKRKKKAMMKAKRTKSSRDWNI